MYSLNRHANLAGRRCGRCVCLEHTAQCGPKKNDQTEKTGDKENSQPDDDEEEEEDSNLPSDSSEKGRKRRKDGRWQ